MKAGSDSYIPALRYRWLTRFYDPVVRLTTREATFKRDLLRQARIEPGQQILDLGCGTGTLTTMIKRTFPEAEVFGLDADPDALKLAQAKLQANGIDARLHEGLASALPYSLESFDAVVSSLLFHHLSFEVKHKTMYEVFRVLRPGGQFLVADWGKPANAAMRLAFLSVQILDGFATTADNLRGLLPDLMTAAGFERVSITNSYSTLLGTLSLYSAVKPKARVQEET